MTQKERERLEEKKAEIRERLAEIREKRVKRASVYVKPRYDEVFWKGVEWLDRES